MKNKVKARALVLFSGGLDSRLAIKILQEQNIEPIAVMFKLPFSGGCCNDEFCSFRYTQIQGIKLHIIDCTKGKLFKEYLEMLKSPKHGIGSGINPCIDCRIFILKHAKSLLKKYDADFIATGEVLGERPMSQYRKALEKIEMQTGLQHQILRPLSAKLLSETEAEKQGLVDRNKLLAISGRSRKPQMALAAKYKIKYPSPAGGCILCEKDYPRKIKDMFKHHKDITYELSQTLSGFRHFRDKGKIILGRDKMENQHLEKLNKKLKWNLLIPKTPGPTAVFENKQDLQLAKELIESYSSKDLKLRKKFEKHKI